MKIIVKKFGETSVSSTRKIKNIAKKLAEESSQNKIVIVLSTMGKTTDQLVSVGTKMFEKSDPKDYDLLVSSGDQVSISLLSMAIKELEQDSVAYTGCGKNRNKQCSYIYENNPNNY